MATAAIVVAAPTVVEGAIAGAETAMLKATVACVNSTICAAVFGLGGAAGAEAASNIENESQTADRLLRYVGPDKMQETGQAMSGAFRDKAMSVFSEKLGATAKEVLQTFSHGAGNGAVYALDEASVLQVQGVTEIIKTQGITGSPLLDQAHFEIINSASKSVAQAIRDLAVLVLGGNQ